jgi:hypothetical protein
MKLERLMGWLQKHLPVAQIPGKKYGAFGEWGMSAGKVEVLLVVSELDVNRNAET